MAQSQVIDWLNENMYRMYPLLESSNRVATDSYALPTTVILDLNLYVPGYPLTDNVQLISIEISGNTATFTFTGTNIFVISDITAVSYPYQIPRLSNGSTMSVGAGILTIPSGTHTFSALYVEPAVVFEMSNAWLGVAEITLNPEYVGVGSGGQFYAPELPLTLQGSPSTFTGDITLYSGYNFDINFNVNAINLSVLQNYGLQPTCDTEFITSGSKDCGDIISYINGVPPDATGHFSITNSNDILLIDGNTLDFFVDEITDDIANPHSLFVGLTFQLSDICKPVSPLPSS